MKNADTIEAPQPRAVTGLRTGGRIKFEKTVTVNRPAMELYEFWREFGNLPLFMKHVASVSSNGDGSHHWTAQTDRGMTLEWDSRVIEDKPGELICWESLPGCEFENAGCVRFAGAPGGRGTSVRMTLSYVPGGGNVGARMSKVLNKPIAQEIAQDLFNFKSLMETGEIATIEGQPRGNSRQKKKQSV